MTTIESVPGGAAVHAEWQRLLGNHFEAIRPLLRPTDELAGAYPAATGWGVPDVVVEHGPDDFVAVSEEGRPARPLRRQDVLVWRLDTRSLAQRLTDLCGFEPAFEKIPGCSDAWKLGHHKLARGDSIPVWLCAPLETADLERFLNATAARRRGGYVLAIPTRRRLKQTVEQILDATDGFPLVLEESLTMTSDGSWQVWPDAMRSLQEFEERLCLEEQPLGSREQWVLTAMLELGAVDSDHRKTTARITNQSHGANGDANTMKSVLADLGTKGFVSTKKGPGGGCWLTSKGLARARRL